MNKILKMIPAGIKPATSPVRRVRDNHYTKETCHNFVAKILTDRVQLLHLEN